MIRSSQIRRVHVFVQVYKLKSPYLEIILQLTIVRELDFIGMTFKWCYEKGRKCSRYNPQPFIAIGMPGVMQFKAQKYFIQ